ncbi:hypothetical protein KAR91_25600 [Candidatus Pacearchaeota archaeon]|nr:hypothetical protein [Candidatus Pacearchaeota archaeon]
MKSQKPLGHKAYGHIPHFIGSRMTPMDKHCEPGHQRIMTEKARDKKDLIIVQEKLDGSNMAIAKINGQIIALSRAGYTAISSPYKQHHIFDTWVFNNQKRFDKLLNEGERIVGEWLVQAHSTRYELFHEPFVVFDIMVKHERLNYHDFLLRVLPLGFIIPRLIHIGQPLKFQYAKEAIKTSGHGAIDLVEGFVYRCEREKKVDFLCKWVRPDKKDGIYLPEMSGKEAVWNVT